MNDVLNPKQVAEFLGIGRTKAYELLRRKDFPVLKIGRLKRVPREELKKWMMKIVLEEGGSI